MAERKRLLRHRVSDTRIERPVPRCLRGMLRLDLVEGFKIGDSSSHTQDLVVSSGGGTLGPPTY